MPTFLLPAQIVKELLYCLGIGLLLAMVHNSFRLLAACSRLTLFLLDIGCFALAAILLCGFAASVSEAGVPRGYMAFAMLAGAIGYTWVLGPLTADFQMWLRWLLSRPFVLVMLPVKGIAALLRRGAQAIFKKAVNFLRIRRKNKLKKRRRMMYNSNN